jgi:hypothetical protein
MIPITRISTATLLQPEIIVLKLGILKSKYPLYMENLGVHYGAETKILCEEKSIWQPSRMSDPGSRTT